VVVVVAALLEGRLAAAPLDFDRPEVWRAGEDVRALAQSPDGLLWVGTAAGVLRFDGRDFKPVEGPPAGAAAAALLVARDGAIWVGLGRPALLLRFAGGAPRRISADQGLHAGQITALLEDRDGAIWVGTDAGLWQVEADDKISRRPTARGHEAIRALARDPDGGLWIATTAGLGRWRAGGFRAVWAGGPVDALVVRGPGRLLLGCGTGKQRGLHTAAVGADGALAVERVWSEGGVLSLLSDGGGGWWAGTSSALARISERGGRFVYDEQLDAAQLPARRVGALLAARDGGLWLGTQQGLVHVPRSRPFRAVSLDGHQVPSMLAASDGSIWALVGSRRLVHLRDGERAETVSIDAPNGTVGLLEDPPGTLWIGSWMQGLFRLEQGRVTRAELPGWDPGDTVRPLLASRRLGLLLAVGDGHLAALEGGRLRWVPLAGIRLGCEIVSAVEEPGGRLWLASEDAGLVSLEAGQARRLGTAEGLPTLALTQLWRGSEGSLWIGTRGAGLVRLRDGRFTAIGKRDGLGTDAVAAILPDGGDGLYLVTVGDGVARVRERDLLDFAEGRAPRVPSVLVSSRDGLPAAGGSWRSPPPGALDRGGRLWLGLFRDAVVFPRPAALPAPSPPAALLERIRLGGQDLPLEGGAALEAPAGQGPLEVRYTAALFEGREQLRFRYRLDGLDTAWREGGEGHEAYYPRLASGAYRFRVAATMSGRTDGETGAEAVFALVLVPPLHQRPAFFLGLGAALLAAVLLAHRLRLRLLRLRFAELTDERNRIAREIHDSLEQTLFAARLQIDAAAGGEPVGPLARAGELVERGIEEVRAAVWSLRVGVFGRADLGVAISVTAGEALRGTSVAFALEREGEPYRLPALTEWHLGQVVREAFTNALKHARPRHLTARLEFRRDRLLVSVIDDGAGFASTPAGAPPPGHYGLPGMRERLRAFGGSVTVDSAPGRGTTVRLEVPRKEAERRE
jgi:signal transduction histidine kinase/ligand-binding sensor domain-containing protein